MEDETKAINQRTSEIDIIDLILQLWKGRMIIIKTTFAFIALGFIIAFGSTKEYKTVARLLPEAKDTQGGASALLRQFGGLGGMNVFGGDGTDAIRPDLYPEVINSTEFYINLMQHEISIKGEEGFESIVVYNYWEKYLGAGFIKKIEKYTLRLPWTVASWFRKTKKQEPESITSLKGLKVLTEKQNSAVKHLRGRVGSSIDQRTGIINISAEFPDPFVSAQIAELAVNYLRDYITEYRIEKAKKDLEFITERHTEKEKKFVESQIALANFRDANRNVISARVQTEEQRLQDQYNLAFNIYNGLSQQLEQARIKVQEETPVLKLIEQLRVPFDRSKPRRALILILYTFLGGFFGVISVFAKAIWEKISYRFK